MRRGEPWISVPPLAKQPEPANLAALKAEISSRWGMIDLLDMLKEVDRATGFTADFTSVASRTSIAPDVLRRRLLLDLCQRVAARAARTMEVSSTRNRVPGVRVVRRMRWPPPREHSSSRTGRHSQVWAGTRAASIRPVASCQSSGTARGRAGLAWVPW